MSNHDKAERKYLKHADADYARDVAQRGGETFEQWKARKARYGGYAKSIAKAYCSKCKGPHVYKHGKR